MSTRPARPKPVPRRPRITLAAIRRYARQVAERFQPDRIILFGSFAYGTPHADSDVDLLVVMPTRDMRHQAFRIREMIDAPFALDLLVRTPKYLQRRIDQGDWFLREIVSRGKVLHEKSDEGVGRESRGGLARRGPIGPDGSDRSGDVS